MAKTKKNKIKPMWFALGFLVFFIVPTASIYLATAVPEDYDVKKTFTIITAVLLIPLVIKGNMPPNSPEELTQFDKFFHKPQTMSFMHGLGTGFLLLVTGFFGLLFWALFS